MRRLLTQGQIDARIKDVASQINRDYSNRALTVVGVLNGAFMFTSDLAKQLSVPLEVGFVKATSYDGKSSTGEVKIELPPTVDIGGKDVLIVEDVVDTGQTIVALKRYLKDLGALDIQVCAFAMKMAMPGVKYKCFWFPGHFIVGYGMDLDGQFRNLPELYVYE